MHFELFGDQCSMGLYVSNIYVHGAPFFDQRPLCGIDPDLDHARLINVIDNKSCIQCLCYSRATEYTSPLYPVEVRSTSVHNYPTAQRKCSFLLRWSEQGDMLICFFCNFLITMNPTMLSDGQNETSKHGRLR